MGVHLTAGLGSALHISSSIEDSVSDLIFSTVGELEEKFSAIMESKVRSRNH